MKNPTEYDGVRQQSDAGSSLRLFRFAARLKPTQTLLAVYAE